MLLDTEFNFKNMVGKYEIRRNDIIYPIPIIKCIQYGDYKAVYNNFSKTDSIAMIFANINPNNENEIIQFCNHYGLIGQYRSKENTYNDDYYSFDYISSIEKKSFTNGLGNQAMPLIHFQHGVVDMHACLELYSAIHSKQINLSSIIKNITYFAFDENSHENDKINVSMDNGSKKAVINMKNFEIVTFNQSYREYLTSGNYSNKSHNEKIKSYLTKLERTIKEMKSTDNIKFSGHMFSDAPHIHNTWQAIVHIYLELLKYYSISFNGPFCEIEFSPKLNDSNIQNIFPDCNIIISLAKSILSDMMNVHLAKVQPEFRSQNKDILPNWHIPSLLDAMYLEVFFNTINQAHQIKICSNEKCKKHFIAYNPRRIYCSEQCAWATSKRHTRNALNTH